MYIEALQRTVRKIELNDELVQRYAKKILGFAYSKMHNSFGAEDLSQEILCSLADSLRRQDHISDMDGYVYTICCYTWSKYLRANKKHWNNLDVDWIQDLQDGQNVEEETIASLLVERLRTEIAYLSHMHRQITLLFYAQNKTGEEISKLLHIPSSTVRWHVSEIKKKLKAGIEMDENLSYQPKRLWCGHDGWSNDMHMHGIGHNPLVDNICIACYGQALTIEELSRTLRVAAAYIEPLVEDLLYMDYLKMAGKNKVQTNFFIHTIRYDLRIAQYKLHHIGPYAEKIITAFRTHWPEIEAIGFVGSGLDRDFLLWALIPLSLQNWYYRSLSAVLQNNHIQIDTPKRKDGTQHWVCAGLMGEEWPDGFTAEEIDFKEKSNGNGIKTRGSDGDEHSLQYDGYATMKAGIPWREFGSPVGDLRGIRRIAELIKTGEAPNEYDKAIISSLAEPGYVKMEKDKPVLLIPFLDKEEYARLQRVLDGIQKEAGETLFADFIEGFAAAMEKEIPAFISPSERIYLQYQAYPQYAVLYWLADNGRLRYPTDEEAKRLCTVVWCE